MMEFYITFQVSKIDSWQSFAIKKIDRTNAIELQTDIYNQHKQKVTTGVAKVKLVQTVLLKDKKEKTKRVRQL